MPVINHQAMLGEILKRKEDYTANRLRKERDELVKLWRETYPEAANEPAAHLHLLILVEGRMEDRADPLERWTNDVYMVAKRVHSKDPVFGTNGGMIQLGINAHDGTARHDWREFQAIKNQLAGPECEAFELYPAESRLLDPSNYYSLWCFPGLKRIKVGEPDRRVWDASEAWAPQRKLADGSEAANAR